MQDGFEQGFLSTMEAALGSVFLRAAKNASNMSWDIGHVPKGPARRAVLGTTDGWALWKGTKHKDVAWELLKLATTSSFYDMQSRIEGRVPSRKSSLDNGVKIVREQLPATQGVNLKMITDALTTRNYPTVDESFICQSEALPVLQPALDEVYKKGTAGVTLFRDIKPQLDGAWRAGPGEGVQVAVAPNGAGSTPSHIGQMGANRLLIKLRPTALGAYRATGSTGARQAEGRPRGCARRSWEITDGQCAGAHPAGGRHGGAGADGAAGRTRQC